MELSQVLESIAQSGDGVMVAASDEQIVSWNQAAQELTGYSPEEALGRPCCALLRGTDRYGNAVCFPGCAVMMCARQRGVVRHFELSVVGRDGLRRWLDVSSIPLRDADGRLLALAHLMRAISAPGQLERMLQEALSRVEHSDLSLAKDGAALQTLTDREREILHLLSQGASTAVIAAELVITPKTVRNHIDRILSKLGMHSRLEAVALVSDRRVPSGLYAPPTSTAAASHPRERSGY